MILINKEKLLSLNNDSFVYATRLLQILNPTTGVNISNKVHNDFIGARQKLISDINNHPEKLNDDYFSNFIIDNFLKSPDGTVITNIDYIRKYINSNFDEINKFVEREDIVTLFSKNYLNNTPKSLDKELFLKNLMAINYEPINKKNDIKEKKDIDQLVKDLLEKYQINSLQLNSFISEDDTLNVIKNLDYIFGKICDITGLPSKEIGKSELVLSIGVKNDDCNGWMVYKSYGKETEIVMTQKANFSVLAHEWMHFFDARLDEEKNITWAKFKKNIVNENFEENKIDLSVLNYINFEDYLKRFVINHVKVEYKDELIKEINQIQNIIEKEKTNPAANVDNIKKTINKFVNRWSNGKDFKNAFPDKEFLHRYLSFFKADLDLWENYINKIQLKNKTVFKEHAEISDRHFGHHYSGSEMEMIARSFESFIDSKCLAEKIPAAAGAGNNTLWYPVEKEKDSLNEMWQDMFKKISLNLTKNESDSKIKAVLDRIRKNRNKFNNINN